MLKCTIVNNMIIYNFIFSMITFSVTFHMEVVIPFMLYIFHLNFLITKNKPSEM